MTSLRSTCLRPRPIARIWVMPALLATSLAAGLSSPVSAGVFEDIGGVVKDVGRAADGVVNDIGNGIVDGIKDGCTATVCKPFTKPFGAEEPTRSITYKDYKGTIGGPPHPIKPLGKHPIGPPHPIKPLGKHPSEPAQPAGPIGQNNTGCVGTDGVYRNFPAKICAALEAQKKKADTATAYRPFQHKGYMEYLKRQNEQLKAELEHRGARKDRGPCLDTGRPTRECKFAQRGEEWQAKRGAWSGWREQRRADKRELIGNVIRSLSGKGLGF